MRFRDRLDAGRKLAMALGAYAKQEPIVLALPRGGVAVAAAVAQGVGRPARSRARAQDRGARSIRSWPWAPSSMAAHRPSCATASFRS